MTDTNTSESPTHNRGTSLPPSAESLVGGNNCTEVKEVTSEKAESTTETQRKQAEAIIQALRKASSVSGLRTFNPGEDLMFVNPKQYYRIIKRRQARAKEALRQQEKMAKKKALEKESGSGPSEKKYNYESRHKHAVNRPRLPGGKFAPKKEKQATEEG